MYHTKATDSVVTRTHRDRAEVAAEMGVLIRRDFNLTLVSSITQQWQAVPWQATKTVWTNIRRAYQ